MRSPDGAVSFEHEGTAYTMVFDMRAIAHFEREADVSLVDALVAMELAKKADRAPKISHVGMLMHAGLARHHPELSLEDAMRLATAPGVQSALGVGVAAAMPDASAASAVGNVPAPAKPKQKASTGTKRSRARSKAG